MQTSYFNTPHYRQIKFKFMPPTNHRSPKLKIFESARDNNNKTKSIYFDYNQQINDVNEQACQILTANGFNIVAKAYEIETSKTITSIGSCFNNLGWNNMADTNLIKIS